MQNLKLAVIGLLWLPLSIIPATALDVSDSIEFLRDENWAEAHRVLEEVIDSNAYDGLAHFYLGRSLSNMDRCEEAIVHYEQSIGLGVNSGRNGMRNALLGKARCEALIGEHQDALVSLTEAWKNWGFDDFSSLVNDDALASFTEAREFRALAGLTARDTRNSRWQADIDYFIRLITETHPDSFHATEERNWRGAARDLRRNVGRQTDTEIVGELMRLAAMIGDGHTSVYPPIEGELAWSLLPLQPVSLDGGWYVMAASEAHTDLVGTRITGVGTYSMDRMMELARQFTPSDNEFTAHWMAGNVFQLYEFYEIAGAVSVPGQVTMSFELPNGTEISRDLVAAPIDRNPTIPSTPASWVRADGGGEVALWRDQLDQTFYTQMISSDTLYVRLNQIANTEEMSLADFGESILNTLQEEEATSLVLDLRHNNGGNANLARDFVVSLLRHEPLSESGHLFVLIGPRSFSATMYLVGALEQYMDPTLIGWPTGGRPTVYSTERPFTLPYSGVAGSVSARQHIDGFSADDRRPAFLPDYLEWPTMADVQNGRDPLIERALELSSN